MKYDVIIVLAGGITQKESLPASVKKRVRTAKKLYNQRLAAHILMSGKWSKHWDKRHPSQTEAQLMAEYAHSLGVPKKALFMENYSQNTYENAVHVLKHFLKPKGWRRIAIVTSDFHVRRAKYTFTQVLGKKYTLHVVGVHTTTYALRWLSLQIKENIQLCSHWLLQHHIDRR